MELRVNRLRDIKEESACEEKDRKVPEEVTMVDKHSHQRNTW